MPKYTGFSVSGCVRDIALGLVNLDDVDQIIGGTNIDLSSEYEIQRIIDWYSESFWKDLPETASIFRKLVAAGKIIQPRNSDEEPSRLPYWGYGHWIMKFPMKEEHHREALHAWRQLLSIPE